MLTQIMLPEHKSYLMGTVHPARSFLYRSLYRNVIEAFKIVDIELVFDISKHEHARLMYKLNMTLSLSSDSGKFM